MDYQERYNLWLSKVKDYQAVQELKNMTEEEKKSAFFKELGFGTAGLRGIIGLGSNRINIYNVSKVTKALAEYVKIHNGKSVAISYDSRNMSKEFAELTASILAKENIVVYLVKEMMPTPFLSYMVRYYKSDAGVMITASHNPKDYNGYKVYSKDGSQLLEEPSYEIMKLAEKYDIFNIELASIEEAAKNGLIKYIDDKIIDDYLNEVKSVSLNEIKDINVVYTALNGVGIQTLPKLLKERGVNIELNKIQCVPDKNFTTCPYPNPEIEEVYDLSLKIAKNNKADLIIASDPDADRLGIMVRQKSKYIHLTGNELGIIFADYLLKNAKTKDSIIIKSVVSTSLVEKLAKKYNAVCKNVLTGFKYIGEFITDLEEKGCVNRFILGFEESSGYLIGSHIRDKDATVAAMVVCEIASELKKQGKTIVDRLNEIYDEFGYYQSYVYSYKFSGFSGDKKMKEILFNLREKSPKKIADANVVGVKDYIGGIEGLPKANLISFDLSDGTNIMIRPSGTEPLIKVYLTLTKTKEINKANNKIYKKYFEKMFK